MLTRLFLNAPKAQAEHMHRLFEREFEDDGLPLAIAETDEARAIHEISLYVEGDVEPVVARLRAIISGLSPAFEIRSEAVPDIDWVSHSLQGLSAVRNGRFLVYGAHERQRLRVNDIGIEVEAGLAFGTGHHGTTTGCLDMISRILKAEKPEHALDLGTGSAVLAIAIAKAARIPVLATDIDRIATRVANENIRLNGVAALVETRTAAGLQHPVFAARGPFGLIVANILARPLMRLAPDMARHIERDGSLILSGILDRQRNAVIAAYAGQGFRHVVTLHRDGWATIHMKR